MITKDVARQPRVATQSLAGRRPYQEDAILIVHLTDGRILLAVADGMGGHAAGEVASALALETLQKSLEAGIDFAQAFRDANDQVHQKGQEAGKQGMGTTLVAMLLEGDHYQVANVGDSRAYLLSEGQIARITEDHSFVTEAIKRGQSEEEAMTSRWKDALTRSIGTAPAVEVDLFGPFPVEQDTALLLCSDGLYKTLSDEDLHELFTRSSGPKGAVQSLASNAFDRGSDDNISVAIAEFGEVPRERPAGTMPLEFEPPEPSDEQLSEDAGAGADSASEAWDEEDEAVAGMSVGDEPSGSASIAAAVPSEPFGGRMMALAALVVALVAGVIYLVAR